MVRACVRFSMVIRNTNCSVSSKAVGGHLGLGSVVVGAAPLLAEAEHLRLNIPSGFQ